MRLLKFAAFLSLWVVFFVLVAIVHLWISILGLPNRWKILSRLNRNYTLLLRLILNIKVTIAGDEGQLERGGYVVIGQPRQLRRRHRARQHIPDSFCIETRGQTLADRWSME